MVSLIIFPEIIALINLRIPRKHTHNKNVFLVPIHKPNTGANSFLPRALFLANIISIQHLICLVRHASLL